MELFGYHINNKDIIGIGPLQEYRYPGAPEGKEPRRWTFSLLLNHRNQVIQSKEFFLPKDEAEHSSWKEEYDEAKGRVKILIGDAGKYKPRRRI